VTEKPVQQKKQWSFACPSKYKSCECRNLSSLGHIHALSDYKMQANFIQYSAWKTVSYGVENIQGSKSLGAQLFLALVT
jgi:hypothetical protein